MARLRIRWKKSTIGYNQRQRDTIRSLGLHRLNGTVEHEDSPSLRGMILQVRHLVEVAEVGDGTRTGGQT
jgi:large subunit ribosomal protein L30